MLRRKILIVAGALALTAPTLAYADTGVDRFDEAPSKAKIDTTFVPASLDQSTKVTVMVELSGDPVAVVEATTDGQLSDARRSQIRSGLKKSQDRVKSEIQDRGGKVLSQMQSAYNGMRVTLPRKQVSAVSQLDGVVSVTAAPVHTIDNAVSVPFLGVPKVWQNTKYLGEGVKVAIIDTGIDYTHAGFGGKGTVEAFEDAQQNAAKEADPEWFGPNAPRVKGGHDFVGDDYNADPNADPEGDFPYQPVPHPDANPLDCQGHGSHVAGTAGGSGVNEDGSTFAGPYNSTTASKTFKVGPGVAPKVDLYALKVFGCEGSTDVVTEAIDWAVKNNMNVINMSLGSSYGTVGDADSIAAQNATAAGVVVVASAGNSGPNPYLTGSPATGRGVISVAAVDSTKSFAGAKLTFDGKTMDAINANGAALPTGSHPIVYLKDDSATGRNEALGCVPDDYTANGISAGSGQVGVAQRGTCARVRKAAAGQQAGAAAVIMVNSDDSYPPYEGQITNIPAEDPPLELPAEDYSVTIPFLGVRQSDGAALQAADGKALTLAAATLTNPGFKGYASFSSGGPRNGDSGLKPSVSAPGVSISSVAVGTGTGAEVMSGTSMAAPHVAGVAALARQAHKKWNAQQISTALVTTADANKVTGYRLTLGGGLVDTLQVVNTSVFAYGDSYRTKAGTITEGTLSYGFSEPSGTYTGVKKLTLVNKGSKKAIFVLSNEKTGQSRPATVTFSRRVVVVKANSSATVKVTLKAKGSSVGSSIADPEDQFGFYEVSGNVKIATDGKGTLRVPYLLVPRAQAKVTASQKSVKSTAIVTGEKTVEGVTTSPSAAPSATASTTPSTKPTDGPSTTPPPATRFADVKLTNTKGALTATTDFYTWGLYDRTDVRKGTGFDLRAAGVQSFDTDDGDQFLVFAVNNWTRWSNAATLEFDVSIDLNGDEQVDFVLFSADSGLVRAQSPDGETEVFLYSVADNATYASGFLAQSPTDSSTILLPVYASQLGLSAESGAFDYTVASYSVIDSSLSDEFYNKANYDPFNPAISNGHSADVRVNRSATVQLTVNSAQVNAQKPLGTMVVVLDNKSGENEALLLNKP